MIVQRMMVRGVKTVPETWQFTVNTEATAQGEKKTGIPFNLHGQDGVVLSVDWGDGTNSVLSASDYAEDDSTASVHEYTDAGVYAIKVASANWVDCCIFTSSSATISTINNVTASLYWFRRTLVSVDSELPELFGRNSYSSTQGLVKGVDSFSALFSGCSYLSSIRSGLLDNNSKATNLDSCFRNCISLATVPSDLFDKNTLVTSFSFCFDGCSSLASIPAGLFDNNVLAQNFGACFGNCYSLTSIPTDLFKRNVAATSYNQCFRMANVASSDLGDFSIRIGSSSVSSCSTFCSVKTGATRTIYVPSGSTTETTFNAVASDLGLTIIGE